MDTTRRRLIDAALHLFLSQGVHVTGVVAIAAEAQVTKMTLYSHFASKDALIVACLEERDRVWQIEVERLLQAHDDPVNRILAFFDLYRQYLQRDSWRGCLFVNSAAEFPDTNHPVNIAVARHKQGIMDNLATLAASAGLSSPKIVADGIFLLLEGSFLSGAMGQDVEVFNTAKQMAGCWIEQGRKTA